MCKKITLPISGPQHPTVPNEMIENYKEIYSLVKQEFRDKQFSRFFPLQGVNYNETIQLSKSAFRPDVDFANEKEAVEKYMEPAVRLMLVGRSVNGWTELSEKTADEFVASAADTIIREGFSWLRDDGQGKDTYIRDYDQKECRYNINGSSFFRCTRKILNQMKPITMLDQRWFEHIVWSNLYTVAPLHRKNAEGKLQDIQLENSKKLLEQQIAFYKPSHILFVTDWEWWFDRFADVFSDVRKVGDSIKDNVVGKGIYNNAKVVVTVRPDRTKPNRPNEEQFVRDVVNSFCD